MTRGILEGTSLYMDEINRLPGENRAHIFWECPSVKGTLTELCNNIAGTNNRDIDREKYFCGWHEKTRDGTILSIICVNALQYIIYNCKQRMRFLTISRIREEFEGISRYTRWANRVGEIQNLFRKLLNVG